MSEQPPDQPQQDPLAEPRWQPDEVHYPDPLAESHWQQPGQQSPHTQPEPDRPAQLEPYPPQWQPPDPRQPPARGYPVPGGGSASGGRQDNRILVWLVVGGVLLLATFALIVGLLIAHSKRPTEAVASHPTPVTTSAERDPVTTSAEPVPETTAATTPPASAAEVIKVGTAEFAEYSDGLLVQVISVRRATFSDLSNAPGPGVIATVRITNGTPARVSLEFVDVTLRYGIDGVESDYVIDDNVHDFSGGLSRGRTATATYGFSVPRNQRVVTVEVTPGLDYNASTFEGRIT